MAKEANFKVFRGRELKLVLVYTEDITNITVTSTATDGTTDYAATVSKSIVDKTWTITWSDTQTTAMTQPHYNYDIKITDGTNDYQGYYGVFTMRDSVT